MKERKPTRHYTVQEVLDIIEIRPKKYRTTFDGDEINITPRLMMYKKCGVKCVVCGLEGQYFVKERPEPTQVWHLNLYAVVDGEEVLMTKDHIIPYARGGKNQLDNYQPMCQPCNLAKGTTMEGEGPT